MARLEKILELKTILSLECLYPDERVSFGVEVGRCTNNF